MNWMLVYAVPCRALARPWPAPGPYGTDCTVTLCSKAGVGRGAAWRVHAWTELDAPPGARSQLLESRAANVPPPSWTRLHPSPLQKEMKSLLLDELIDCCGRELNQPVRRIVRATSRSRGRCPAVFYFGGAGRSLSVRRGAFPCPAAQRGLSLARCQDVLNILTVLVLVPFLAPCPCPPLAFVGLLCVFSRRRAFQSPQPRIKNSSFGAVAG